jgi:Outer membrane protein Omp28
MRTTLLTLAAALPAAVCAQAYDLTVVEAASYRYVSPGQYVFKPVVRNLGTQAITSFRLNWRVDNGPVEQCAINTFEVYPLIIANVTNRVIACQPLNLPALGMHTLEVWCDMLNGFAVDQNTANDLLSQTIEVLPYVPSKQVLVDYFTHTICQPCGEDGEPKVAAMEAQFPGLVHGVAIHAASGDPYSSSSTLALNDSLHVGAHPRVFLDRFKFPWFDDLFTYSAYDYYVPWRMAGDRLEYPEPLEVRFNDISYNSTTRVMEAEVAIDFVASMNEPLAVNLFITEDSVFGYQAGAPQPNNHYHRHVFRRELNGILGMPGDIPANVAAGNSYSRSFTTVLPTGWNEDRIVLYAFVQHLNDQDYLDRRILNMTAENMLNNDVGLDEDRTGEMMLWPALAPEQVHLKIERPLGQGDRIDVVSADGKLLRVLPSYGGQVIFEIPTSGMSAGGYAVVVRQDGSVVSRRFVVP